jgi:hypothetical protein
MRTQDLSALFQRVFDLARRKQSRGRRICPVVLVVGMQQSELVVVYDGSVEGAYWQL